MDRRKKRSGNIPRLTASEPKNKLNMILFRISKPLQGVTSAKQISASLNTQYINKRQIEKRILANQGKKLELYPSSW